MFGATFARLATDAGKRCLVIDRRDHIGGNCYTREVSGIHVHCYGPHIFHCEDARIWQFVNRFAEFNQFHYTPIAIHQGRAYSLPPNLFTFNQMWGVTNPDSARQRIDAQRLHLSRKPVNLEEQALMLVGRDIYETLIKDYTRKQWQRDPRDLPPAIIKRLPIRFTWNNNYFNDRYQGIPIGGYTRFFERLLKGIKVLKEIDYLHDRGYWNQKATKVIYSGKIDEFFGYDLGDLEYRTLSFEFEYLQTENFQGNAAINYTDMTVPWTRIIEHRHFDCHARSKKTIITREIPIASDRKSEPYYPIEDDLNRARWRQYAKRAQQEASVYLGGRLAEYRYYDMHQVIGSAHAMARRLLNS